MSDKKKKNGGEQKHTNEKTRYFVEQVIRVTEKKKKIMDMHLPLFCSAVEKSCRLFGKRTRISKRI